MLSCDLKQGVFVIFEQLFLLIDYCQTWPDLKRYVELGQFLLLFCVKVLFVEFKTNLKMVGCFCLNYFICVKELKNGVYLYGWNISSNFQKQSSLYKEAPTLVFSFEFCEISKNTFYYRTPLVATSELYKTQWRVETLTYW